jgi:hypothetical protein
MPEWADDEKNCVIQPTCLHIPGVHPHHLLTPLQAQQHFLIALLGVDTPAIVATG